MSKVADTLEEAQKHNELINKEFGGDLIDEADEEEAKESESDIPHEVTKTKTKQSSPEHIKIEVDDSEEQK